MAISVSSCATSVAYAHPTRMLSFSVKRHRFQNCGPLTQTCAKPNFSTASRPHAPKSTRPVTRQQLWNLPLAGSTSYVPILVPNSAPSFLWLSADPGCGKSVLASFLIDHYASMQPEDTPKICYFFFKSDNAEQNDAVHAMQAILRQLLLQHRSLINVALSCLNDNRPDSVQTLWNAFISVAEHPDTGDTICIIDGLDECEMGSGKQFANLVSAHSSGTVSKAELTKPSRLKLLVASRPDTAFKIIFDKPASQSETQSSHPSDKTKTQISMIRLRGEDETEAISDDVSVVIKSDISNLEYQGLPFEVLANIQEQLIARADRTFLWVTLILQLLKERVEASASRRELNEILPSRDIDDTYNQLLSGGSDAPRARKVVNLVLAALRPLTLDELSIALAIEGEDHRKWSKRSWSESPTNVDNIEDELVFPYENHIKSLCGHFVRIIRNCVYLVHETARHFLLAREEIPPPDSGSVPWQGSFEKSEARKILLGVCVTFLYCLARRSRCARLAMLVPDCSFSRLRGDILANTLRRSVPRHFYDKRRNQILLQFVPSKPPRVQ